MENFKETEELQEESLKRIKKLIEQTARLNNEEPERRASIENYFKNLHDKINSSTLFLKNVKRDIENIKFKFQEDRKKARDPNNKDYLEMYEKTDREIEEELLNVQYRLDELQQRVGHTKEKMINNWTYKERLSESIKTLENVSKGIFTNNTDKEQEMQ